MKLKKLQNLLSLLPDRLEIAQKAEIEAAIKRSQAINIRDEAVALEKRINHLNDHRAKLVKNSADYEANLARLIAEGEKMKRKVIADFTEHHPTPSINEPCPIQCGFHPEPTKHREDTYSFLDYLEHELELSGDVRAEFKRKLDAIDAELAEAT